MDCSLLQVVTHCFLLLLILLARLLSICFRAPAFVQFTALSGVSFLGGELFPFAVMCVQSDG